MLRWGIGGGLRFRRPESGRYLPADRFQNFKKISLSGIGFPDFKKRASIGFFEKNKFQDFCSRTLSILALSRFHVKIQKSPAFSKLASLFAPRPVIPWRGFLLENQMARPSDIMKSGHQLEIDFALANRVPFDEIANRFGHCPRTVSSYARRMRQDEPQRFARLAIPGLPPLPAAVIFSMARAFAEQHRQALRLAAETIFRQFQSPEALQ